MGDVKPLSDREAIDKITHIAKGEIAMLCTFVRGTMRTRPMGTTGIDADGTFWFMSRQDSGKNTEITANSNVQLVYAVPSRSEYLSLEGTATVTRDQAKLDELWNVFMRTWFNEGKDDPAISLIRVLPTRGYYWDTKHNKMVQLAKIAVGALAGKEMDDGVEGRLKM